MELLQMTLIILMILFLSFYFISFKNRCNLLYLTSLKSPYAFNNPFNFINSTYILMFLKFLSSLNIYFAVITITAVGGRLMVIIFLFNASSLKAAGFIFSGSVNEL